jgi:hypothetical protein
MRVGRKPASRKAGDTVVAAPSRRGGAAADASRTAAEAPADTAARPARQPAAVRGRRPAEPRAQRPGPQTAPAARPVGRPARPKTASQAKARAKARKAKAPKAIRLPLRERLLLKLSGVDLRPRTLLTRIPFVVLVIGSLALGLGITLWLSTDSAQRSYQLSTARALNDALAQQKEALERDVLEAESAPALADAARNLGMIPSRDTAHLVQDPAGNWVVVGTPKPAEGAPPPPLNSKLPDEKPAPPAPAPPPPPPAPKPGARGEVPTPVNGGLPGTLSGSAEVPVVLPPVPNPFSGHAPAGSVLPGPAPLPGPDATGAQGGLVLVPVLPPVTAPSPGLPAAGVLPPADAPLVPLPPVVPAPIAGTPAGAPQ